MTKINKPYSTHFKHLSDLKNWVGKELGLTEWLTIDQEKINTFAKITHDEQWIHTDEDRSKKESPYKQTVAHGFLVLSFASHFAYNCFTINDTVMGVNYGLNKVRFPNATLSNTRLRGRISLLEFEPITKGARYIMKVVFELEGHTKPACVAEFVAIAYTE